MSVWRRKAIECLPEERAYFEQPDTTIYQVFFEVLSATIEAHKQNDIDKLKKYYGFAEWCFRQKQKDLWNAAGVVFYEHLADHNLTYDVIPHWIAPDIYIDTRVQLELRINNEKMKRLDSHYGYGKSHN